MTKRFHDFIITCTALLCYHKNVELHKGRGEVKRKELIDEFFYRQPAVDFENKLKHIQSPRICFTPKKSDDEVIIKGMALNAGTFAGDRYLKTVFEDFNAFLENNGLNKSGYEIAVSIDSSFAKEEFELKVGSVGTVVRVGEREGLRRAIIKIEDMLVLGGGKLKTGSYHYKYLLERRISRSFFSPINRPPKYTDELYDGKDYYPHGYLNKLMHDGVNAVWINTSFRALIRSPYITEFGEGSEKRIKKLKRTAERCALYGIEVFLFLIEPISLYEPEVQSAYPGIYKKYPQVSGNNGGGPIAFCTYSEFGEKYLADSAERLFKQLPEIAGIISITHGERVTSCANTWGDIYGNWYNNCPYCKDKSASQIVAHTVDIFVKSMKKINPKAEFISWTYGHRGKPFGVIEEYVEKVTNNAILMQNFEDDGRVLQLGKKRFALDYYLCYSGPSDMFGFTARQAAQHDKKLYAKMQICCSHELATMPYIPVPGLVYDKMTRAKDIGVKGIMESWFFGNYPCLMSKAADILSTDVKFKDKAEFLTELAKLYFQADNAEIAVKAWQRFEKGYTSYPVNVMFNYYGPMHDGVAWDLSLKPKNFSLPRSWQLQDKPDGDRIGECLFSGHTLEEATELVTRLNDDWQKGLDYLSQLKNPTEEEAGQAAVAEALGILFKSGLNVLKFYLLRDYLGYEKGEPCRVLAEMRDIVLSEIQNSKRLIPLCRKYGTFGYHSEAEGHKFFAEKIERRIHNLEELLNTEFAEVENRIKQGLTPLEYYTGTEEGSVSYKVSRTGIENAEWQCLKDSAAKFRMCEEHDQILTELYSEEETDFLICNEFRLGFPGSTLVISRDGNISLHRDAKTHQSVLDEKIPEYLSAYSCKKADNKGTHLMVRTDKAKSGFIRFPYKMMIRTIAGGNWVADENPVRTLGKSTISAGDFGWLK